MKRGLLSKIAYTNSLWGIGLLLLLAATLATIFSSNDGASYIKSDLFDTIDNYSFLGIAIADISNNAVVGHLFQFLFLLLTGWVLQFMSNEFRLIRVRSYFPFFLFCLLVGTLLPKIHLDGAALSSLFLMLSFVPLFRSINRGQEARSAFDATVLLVLASLLQSRLLYLLPFFWLVMGVLQVLNLRSLLASIFGLLTVFWIIIGICFLMGDYTYLIVYSIDLTNFHLFHLAEISLAEILYNLFLVLLMISAIISFWPKQHLDKLKTRNYLNSMLLLWLALLIIWLFSANDESYLLPLVSLSTIVIAHFFSLVESLYSRFLFFALIGLSFTIFFLF